MPELLDPARPREPPRPAAGGAGRVVQPRLIVALVLITGGVLWALARGLSFYGVIPLHLGYDVDQPPVLLVLVGGWLAYRSRRR